MYKSECTLVIPCLINCLTASWQKMYWSWSRHFSTCSDEIELTTVWTSFSRCFRIRIKCAARLSDRCSTRWRRIESIRIVHPVLPTPALKHWYVRMILDHVHELIYLNKQYMDLLLCLFLIILHTPLGLIVRKARKADYFFQALSNVWEQANAWNHEFWPAMDHNTASRMNIRHVIDEVQQREHWGWYAVIWPPNEVKLVDFSFRLKSAYFLLFQNFFISTGGRLFVIFRLSILCEKWALIVSESKLIW